MNMTALRHIAGALTAIALCFGAFAMAPAQAASSAVILMYHRFGEVTLPSTNIGLEQFEAHLNELLTGGYTVLPVPEIVAALKSGTELPDRTVGITIDDAYRSVYAEAWPRLQAAGFPFTVFVSTDGVDQQLVGSMTWDQIRELDAAGVTIGHHGAAHGHMAYASDDHNTADIAKASARFAEELGSVPELFAYPYGEYGRVLRDTVATQFSAAFGQQSGAIYAGIDMHQLPRFALNEKYGNLKRFRLVASTLPLPALDITPADRLLGSNPPAIGFTVTGEVKGLAQLNCFIQGQEKVEIQRLGPNRFEVRAAQAFSRGRTRMNCTLPGPEGRWRWFGMQFLVPPTS